MEPFHSLQTQKYARAVKLLYFTVVVCANIVRYHRHLTAFGNNLRKQSAFMF